MTPQRSLNFVPPPWPRLLGHGAAPWQRGATVALLAVSASLLALAAAASAWQRQALATQRDALAPRAAPVAAAASAPLLNATERVRINRVVRSLNTPWSPIFQALESQASPRVALLALETDAERGAVRVLTEGPSLDALLAHAQRVQDATPFVRTQLLRIEAPEAVPALPGGPLALSRLSFDLRFTP